MTRVPQCTLYVEIRPDTPDDFRQENRYSYHAVSDFYFSVPFTCLFATGSTSGGDRSLAFVET